LTEQGFLTLVIFYNFFADALNFMIYLHTQQYTVARQGNSNAWLLKIWYQIGFNKKKGPITMTTNNQSCRALMEPSLSSAVAETLKVEQGDKAEKSRVLGPNH
jgi:hypothetical protein